MFLLALVGCTIRGFCDSDGCVFAVDYDGTDVTSVPSVPVLPTMTMLPTATMTPMPTMTIVTPPPEISTAAPTFPFDPTPTQEILATDETGQVVFPTPENPYRYAVNLNSLPIRIRRWPNGDILGGVQPDQCVQVNINVIDAGWVQVYQRNGYGPLGWGFLELFTILSSDELQIYGCV